MKAFEITVKGKVQGVFFRASTRDKAVELGLRGWCMNLPNGNVLIHAEGGVEKLNALLQWCKIGPTMANVSSVEYHENEVKGHLTFYIRKV